MIGMVSQLTRSPISPNKAGSRVRAAATAVTTTTVAAYAVEAADVGTTVAVLAEGVVVAT